MPIGDSNFSQTPREMFVQRAKRRGEKTTFIDGKEFAISGSGVQKVYNEITGEIKMKNYTEDNIEEIEDLFHELEAPLKTIKDKMTKIKDFAPYDTYNSLVYLKDETRGHDLRIEELQAKIQHLEDILNEPKAKKPKKYI